MRNKILTYRAENIEVESKNESAKCHRMQIIFTSLFGVGILRYFHRIDFTT